MGIGVLWNHIGEGEVTNIAEYASQHYKETQRPLRIAIDTACWIYNNVTKEQTKEIREASGRPSNPMEKAILHRLLRLLFLGIQVHFVFDGPKRPPKRGKVWRATHDKSTDLLRQTLGKLGVSSHTAIAEAEADCAEMQKLGIVDAVWTEDGDGFMFGCTTLIRFHYESKNGKEGKSNTHFRLYKSKDIPKHLPGLDREGFVLYVILNGGDYDKAGLKGFGILNSLKAVQKGLGKSLCKASESGLELWREELREYIKEAKSNIVVPSTFPKFQHLKDYREPLLSDSLAAKWQERPAAIVEEELKPFLQEFYNFQAEKYVQWIVPMRLIRTLAQTNPGQEHSNDRYQVTLAKQNDSTTMKATFLLEAATSLDMSEYAKMNQRDYYEAEFRGTFESLPWIIRRGVPDAMSALTTQSSRKSSKATKSKPSEATGARSVQNLEATNEDTSSAIGKKRGRPRKDINNEETPLPKRKSNSKRSRALADSDINSHTTPSNKPAKPSSAISHYKPPKISKSSAADMEQDQINHTSSYGEPEMSKPPRSSKTSAATRNQEPINLVSDDESQQPKPLPGFIRYDLDSYFESD